MQVTFTDKTEEITLMGDLFYWPPGLFEKIGSWEKATVLDFVLHVFQIGKSELISFY